LRHWQVVEIDLAGMVRTTADGGDARRLGGAQQRQQPAGQGEVSR